MNNSESNLLLRQKSYGAKLMQDINHVITMAAGTLRHNSKPIIDSLKLCSALLIVTYIDLC